VYKQTVYDYDAASALCFYKPEYIARMCDNGTLTRGVHFIIRTYRYGCLIRAVRFITPAGIAFLIDRQKHRIPKRHHGNTRDTPTLHTPTEHPAHLRKP
jgi:hypothetical protein